ncbi:MAG: type II toxin-antitoxin system death-on-curing family toxin [Clostridia bacterium]|jgi:death-on-curing family protein|nr:type II toxin-antitoxin system death-on-curing family toxin [Clostridiaceae bacterium]
MEIEYLTEEFVFYIHMVAIDETFCEYDGHVAYSQEMRGVKDVALFKSAVLLPQQTFGGEDLYPKIIDKASCYLRSLAMDHPFYDGNKRTALLSTIIFLEMNGYKITCNNDTLYNFTKEIVENKYSIEKIANMLNSYVRVSKMSIFKEIFKKINKFFKEKGN